MYIAIIKFACSKVGFYTLQIANNLVVDKTVLMVRLVEPLLFAYNKIRFSCDAALIPPK